MPTSSGSRASSLSPAQGVENRARRKSVTVLTTLDDFRAWRARRRHQDLVLFATKGCIHEGHLAVIRHAAQENKDALLLVTVATSRAQFESGAEYTKFPRTINEDISLIAEHLFCDALLMLGANDLFKYEQEFGARVYFCSESLADDRVAEGECTMLTKLLFILQPSCVYLGENNLIRAKILGRLIADLHAPVAVEYLPTFRDEFGVAYSSRLKNASPTDLFALRAVYRALTVVINAYLNSVFDATVLIDLALGILAGEPHLSVESIRLLHPMGFHPLSVSVDPAIGAIAVIAVRIQSIPFLITDNAILAPYVKNRLGFL